MIDPVTLQYVPSSDENVVSDVFDNIMWGCIDMAEAFAMKQEEEVDE